jgi:predicted esterase
MNNIHTVKNNTHIHRICQMLATIALAAVSCLATAGAPVNLTGTISWTKDYKIYDDSGNIEIALASNFTYQDAIDTVNGVVITPLGVAPYAGVVVSHGLGGNAVDFSSIKARSWFAPANYITVAVDYTHANNAVCSALTECGGSSKNVSRAKTALDILHSQQLIDHLGLGDIVNRDKTFLYGNSMGAMVTVELAQTLGSTVTAAAITAGGIFAQSSRMSALTPSGEAGVANLGIPLIHVHGRKDTTVSPSAAQRLSDALDTYDKVHQMEWNILAGHGVHLADITTDFVLAWFDLYRNDATPRISQLSKRATSTGNQMYVRGTGFGANSNSYSQLRFNATLGTPYSWSNELIKSDVPVNELLGYVSVTVPVGPVDAVNPDGARTFENPIGGARSNRPSYAF